MGKQESAMKSFILLSLLAFCHASQENPTPSDIIYTLYTNNNYNDGVVISYNDAEVNPLFDGTWATVAIVHGYGSNYPVSPWMDQIKNQTLNMEEANVIMVDWGVLAKTPRYDLAARNTKYVGEDLAGLLLDLEQRAGLQRSMVHLIGHSLGAQVMSVAGNAIPNLDRISGLDAALPLFQNASLEDRLDPSDAIFVVAIHTDGGRLVTGHVAFIDPVGDVDFYPNGGSHQKGCLGIVNIINDFQNVTLDDFYACSHDRAYELLIASMTNDFTAYECQDYGTYETGTCHSVMNNLGWNADRNKPGIFYTDTLTQSPFTAAQIRIDIASGSQGVDDGTLFLRVKIPDLKDDEMYLFRNSSVPPYWLRHQMVGGPLGTGVMGTNLEFEYTNKGNSPFLELLYVEGHDITTDEVACYGSGLILASESPLYLKPTGGPCS